ncbi:restriction endonuclease subunit S [Pseudomonas aeruginosa]|uniref:restriction endonuclease subunit S n=1 Tax=Pseudomonas aeruginosa TaxID=287 RepID=UPI00224701DE|nr:restriction endonuclease subunit S [Pseudomonas aeruginosa]EIU1653486.1 restriction endonuclease subunit S [Pseudomonas aeruginosa]MCX2520978.1 restriction endonuclease subunit S [Pseudomonas aeruginosa]
MSWPLVAIGDVAEILSGNAWKSSQFTNESEGRLPIIRIQNISDVATDFIYWDGVALEKYIIKDGDLLLSLSGNVKLCEWSFGNALLNQRIVKLAPTACVDKRYFYWALHRVVAKIEAMARHAVIANVSVTDLKEFQIPLPPLPEQKRIAAILDKADAIRRKRQQAIQLADDFLRAVFLDMFGDPVTNPKGWPLKRFGEIGTWSSGGTPSRTVSDFFEGEINWYSAGELNSRYLDGSVEKISESAIKNSAAKIFKKDSLLVGMYDTAAMKISILKEDSSCNQACANVECNELANVEWLYSYIDYAKDSYLSRRRGVRQKNLNLGMIRDFLLPLPPRDLQDEFVRFVSAVFGIKKKQQEGNDFPVFESLSLKAFSGQL